MDESWFIAKGVQIEIPTTRWHKYWPSQVAIFFVGLVMCAKTNYDSISSNSDDNKKKM